MKYTFLNPDPTLSNNLMSFGFEVDDGWLPLLKELFDKMQVLVDKYRYYDMSVLQVKEKFSTLRVYIVPAYPEIEQLIDEYEDKSAKTCELCGKEGEMREHHRWLKTLCDSCDEKWRNNDIKYRSC